MTIPPLLSAGDWHLNHYDIALGVGVLHKAGARTDRNNMTVQLPEHLPEPCRGLPCSVQPVSPPPSHKKEPHFFTHRQTDIVIRSPHIIMLLIYIKLLMIKC